MSTNYGMPTELLNKGFKNRNLKPALFFTAGNPETAGIPTAAPSMQMWVPAFSYRRGSSSPAPVPGAGGCQPSAALSLLKTQHISKAQGQARADGMLN